MPLELVRRMLRHRDARSTERNAKIADSALVETFGAHQMRRNEIRAQQRAQGVHKARNPRRKHQRGRGFMAGRTGVEPGDPDDNPPE